MKRRNLQRTTALLEGFDSGLDIVEYSTLGDVKAQLKTESATVAYIGETNPLELPEECLNPPMLLNHIDFQRRYKTMYEQHCVREANRLAIPGHLAAYNTFMGGGSELEIYTAYPLTCHCHGEDIPYSVIAGLNEYMAILHREYRYLLAHLPITDAVDRVVTARKSLFMVVVAVMGLVFSQCKRRAA